MRGGSPEENIILIDNIPFDKVSHFSGGSTEEQDKQGGRFSFFAPNLIEEAQFQVGGFSAVPTSPAGKLITTGRCDSRKAPR